MTAAIIDGSIGRGGGHDNKNENEIDNFALLVLCSDVKIYIRIPSSMESSHLLLL